MKLTNFLGGINTKFIPNLIQDNECQYAENVNLATGALTNINKLKSIDKATNKIPYFYDNKFNFYNEDSVFTEVGEVLYIADGGVIKKTLDNNIYQLIIDAPVTTIAPTILEPDDNSNVYGEKIQYCYTYYNEKDGSESAPSGFSGYIDVGELTTDKAGTNTIWQKLSRVKLTNIKKSTDPQVTHIKIYRKTSLTGVWSNIFTIKNENAELIDNVAPETSASLPQLQTFGYNLKVSYNLTPPYAAKYITAYEGVLFASGTGRNKNWLYYSESYSPYIWGTGAIKFDNEITGLGTISTGILVFCKHKTYILYGSVGSLTKQLLLPHTGCIAGNSIVNTSAGCIWQATDGYYIYTNGLQNITYSKLAQKDLKPILAACADDECYYALQTDGKILCINSRLNFAIYYYDAKDITGICVGNGILHCSDGKNLLTYTGDNADIKFVSKHYTENSISAYKNYKTIYVYSEGILNMKVYIDNRLVADVPLNKQGLNEVKVDQANRTGYYLWLEITGQGSVKEIEFIAERRQNGR